MMPEALVEQWQPFDAARLESESAQGSYDTSKADFKPLVSVCNLLKLNLIVSKPILEGAVKEIKVDSIKNI